MEIPKEYRMTRQQRRALAREVSKASNLEQRLDKMHNDVSRATTTALQDILPREIKRAQDERTGQLFTLFVAFMRVRYRHRREWLEDFIVGLNEFCDDMYVEKVRIEDLHQMLYEETGLDCDKFFREISEKEQRRMEKRMQEVNFREG